MINLTLAEIDGIKVRAKDVVVSSTMESGLLLSKDKVLALCAMAKAKIAAEERVRELMLVLDELIDPAREYASEVGSPYVAQQVANATRVLASLSAEKEEERVDG